MSVCERDTDLFKPPTGGLPCSPPDWGLNRQRSCSLARAQPMEPHQPGPVVLILILHPGFKGFYPLFP